MKILVANWKMNGNKASLERLAIDFAAVSDGKGVQVVLCPSFPYLQAVNMVIAGSNIALGAQDCSEHSKGSYTGETSVHMLKDIGCRYVIIGHSERRCHSGEGDAVIARKFGIASLCGIIPILCVGEGLEARKQGEHLEAIKQQLAQIELQRVDNMIIAYEPVWSIGTGMVPESSEVEEMTEFIGHLTLRKFPILYGGSVNGDNCNRLATCSGVAGFLVGNAALDGMEFKKIYAELI